MKKAITFFFIGTMSAWAQLVVTVLLPKTTGTKAIVPLVLGNAFRESVASARATMFLLDDKGSVVGQAVRWIIGGDTNHPPLAVGATNRFYFVVPTGGKPFVTNRLTVTRVNLPGGKRANPVTQVAVRSAAGP